MSADLLDAEAVLARYAPKVARAIEQILPEATGLSARLHEAMRYSALGGGKKLRPALCLAACEAVGGDAEHAVNAAAAIELVHTYSLVHDDLPCMDDDDLRRGRPTNHKVYGEALAVLAGDALLTIAFEVLSEGSGSLSAETRLDMVRILAVSSGVRGMVGGQAVDVASEGAVDVDLPTLQYIHTHKTGALFGGSCRIGALAGGARERETALLGKLGEKLGHAFQIVDDLLDETGTAAALGKSSGKDRIRGKVTYPRILGLEESKRRVQELGRTAEEIADTFGERGRALRALTRFVVERTA